MIGGEVSVERRNSSGYHSGGWVDGRGFVCEYRDCYCCVWVVVSVVVISEWIMIGFLAQAAWMGRDAALVSTIPSFRFVLVNGGD